MGSPFVSGFFYGNAKEMKKHGLNWKAALLESWVQQRQQKSREDVFMQIMSDPEPQRCDSIRIYPLIRIELYD
jgi:hypothetical protein